VPEAAEEQAPGPAAALEAIGPDVELVGVLLSGSRRAALLAPASGGQAQWLDEGQALNGWVIEGVQADRARLRQGERAAVLELRPD
jgi:hypothetical protein